MIKKIISIFLNSLKRKNSLVILNKIIKRLTFTKDEAKKWASENKDDFEKFAKSINPDLYQESLIFSKKLNENAYIKLSKLNIDLGGGGFHQLLYFIVRLVRPKIVVETGVAAGYSSQSILSALNKNNYGTLYSSDFPYIRINNPEKYIGFIVEDELKKNWVLSIEGDEYALPKFTKEIDRIDLFHYDSDKSYSGTRSALKTIKNHIDKNTIIIIDDIQDSLFFQDYIKENKPKYKIFCFKDKYIGIIYNILQ